MRETKNGFGMKGGYAAEGNLQPGDDSEGEGEDEEDEVE